MAFKIPGLRYQVLDADIHEFTFLPDGDDAVLDAFFETLVTIIEAAAPDDILRYIVDVSQTTDYGGMGELIKRFRQLEAQYPNRAAGRTAIIHNSISILSVASTLIDTLAPRKDRTRFFKQEQRDDALAWLLQQ